jgi:hypothetical protein
VRDIGEQAKISEAIARKLIFLATIEHKEFEVALCMLGNPGVPRFS